MASRGGRRARGGRARRSKYLHVFAALLAASAAFAAYFSYEEAALPAGSPAFPAALAVSSVALSFMLPLIALTYLASRGMTLRGLVRGLGLGRGRLPLIAVVSVGFGIFLAVIGLEFGVALFQYATGVSLPTNVQNILQGQQLYYLAFAALIGPINEEIFFRGFLVPRFGIFLSALLFMMLHSGYASIAELLGAFFFGLLSGYVFKRTGSLYTTIIGHVLVNSLSLASLVVMAI